jgi:hypothetical protein
MSDENKKDVSEPLAEARGSAYVGVYLTACKTFMCIRIHGMSLPICMRFAEANQLAEEISGRLPSMAQRMPNESSAATRGLNHENT